jgi:hypothetical protein
MELQNHGVLKMVAAQVAALMGGVYAIRMAEANRLVADAGQAYDDHGNWSWGEAGRLMHRTRVRHYLTDAEQMRRGYHDRGGRGMVLVAIEQMIGYSKSWMRKRPGSHSTSVYLVGYNGEREKTYYAHAVSANCQTVDDAISWIWRGRVRHIVNRQGDIAVVAMPGQSEPLPGGHRIEGDIITHPTHAPIPAPKPGQKIIVGRRASVAFEQKID